MVKVTKKVLLKKKIEEHRKKSLPVSRSKTPTSRSKIVSQFVITEPYIQHQIASLLTSLPEKKKRVRHIKVISEPEPVCELPALSSLDHHEESEMEQTTGETLVQTLPETLHDWENTPVHPGQDISLESISMSLPHILEPSITLPVQETPEAEIFYTPDRIQVENLEFETPDMVSLVQHESTEALIPKEEMVRVLELVAATSIEEVEVRASSESQVEIKRNPFKLLFTFFIKFFTEFAKPYTPSKN